MQLHLSEDQALLARATRAFLAGTSPVSASRSLIDDPSEFDPAVWKQAVEQGWTSVLVPFQMGGLGGSAVDLMVIGQELGRVAFSGPFLSTNLVVDALVHWGSAEQKVKLLPRLMDGSATASWCALEESGVWEPDTITTEATPFDDGYRISGDKIFVPYGGSADYFLVPARAAGGELCHFFVPSGSRGVELEVSTTVDLTRRFSIVHFDQVRVPSTALIGERGVGEQIFSQLLKLAALLVCADSVGGAELMLERTIQYARERIAFGVPIGSYQAIKHKCADMLVWLECARTATLAAAMVVAEDSSEADEAVSVAKSYSGEMLSKLMTESLQIHGGIGYTWEYDLHLYFKRIKTAESLFGDITWHRERLARVLERNC